MLRRGREVYHSACAYCVESPVREHELPVRDLSNQTLTRASDPADPPPLGTDTKPRVAYRRLDDPAADALAVVRFGTGTLACPTVPLCIDVALQPLKDAVGMEEVWLADGPVTMARIGSIRYAADGRSLFGLIELDEREYGSLDATTEAAYAEIAAFQSNSAFPVLLRMWNYMDAINEVSGDLERYRQFCVGRARGMGATSSARYPAATCIGRQQKTHKLQIYWLASRSPGKAVENPRQVSAYRYPVEYGPVSPSFARASVTSDGTMFVSGTASIVGHVSMHRGDPVSQLEETLQNLRVLLAERPPGRLKVYVREPSQLPMIAERLAALAPQSRAIFLAGDICRRELLLEIECVSAPVAASCSA